MKRILFFTSLSFISFFGFSQSDKLIFTNNSYIVLNNSAKLVIGSSSAPLPSNAIASAPNSGIISENENNQVIWNLAGFAGSFNVPFVSSTSLSVIPVILDISSSGIGGGKVSFSTYGCPTWNNNLYKPSDVTHMFDYLTATVNNSDHVIDRFWIIDAQGYTTKPGGTLSLKYLDSEINAAGNFIVELGMGAQRFNSTTGQWGDYLPQGIVDVNANTISNIPVSPAGFYRSWTLSEVLIPLAIDDVSITYSCEDNRKILNWSLTDNSLVEKYEVEVLNGNDFENIATVEVNEANTYSIELPYQDEIYCRLVSIDINGNRKYGDIIKVGCIEKDVSKLIFNSSENTWWLKLPNSKPGSHKLNMYDFTGKLVQSKLIELEKGKNTVQVPTDNLSPGVYNVELRFENECVKHKLIVTDY